MRYALLGPVEVFEEDNGVPLPLGGPRQRAVLASLALRANETVSVDYIVEATWEDPPASPGSNVRTYVNGLRRRLRDDTEDPQLLVTSFPGYRLRARSGEVDLEVFEDLAAQGTMAMKSGELTAAAELYGQALALWRGQPLEGLATGPMLRAEATRLLERRLATAEQYVQVLLAIDRAPEATAVLRPLVSQYPLHEGLAAHLMRALHQAGHRTAALEVFQQISRLLADELSVKPGEELAELRRSILAEPASSSAATATRPPRGGPRASPAVASATAVPAVGDHRATGTVPTAVITSPGKGPVTPAVPRERAAPAALRGLPADIAEFTGRQAELEQLHTWVREATRRPNAVTAPLVVAITGMPGVGKTRLAIRLAHEITRDGHFNQVQLFTNMQGFGPAGEPLDSHTVLARFLRMLGLPPDHIPDNVEERAALYRDRLHGRPSLILLDDVPGPGPLHHLLPGHPSSLVLLTSRRSSWALGAGRTLPLAPFRLDDSIALLARVIGHDRVMREPAAAERVAEFCGNLPLAVALAALRLQIRPWRLSDFAARLSPENTRLSRLNVGGRAIDTAFEASYNKLNSPQRRLFRRLADAPAVFEPDWLCAPHESVEDLLEQLIDESLLQQTSTKTYQLHELLRIYAKQRPED